MTFQIIMGHGTWAGGGGGGGYLSQNWKNVKCSQWHDFRNFKCFLKFSDSTSTKPIEKTLGENENANHSERNQLSFRVHYTNYAIPSYFLLCINVCEDMRILGYNGVRMYICEDVGIGVVMLEIWGYGGH